MSNIELKKEPNRYGRKNIVAYYKGERYEIDFSSKGYSDMIDNFFEYEEDYHTEKDIKRCKEAVRFFTARYEDIILT